MNVCELIFDTVSLNEETGQYQFVDFVRDEKKMAALFEAFVLNFYKRELQDYHVSAPFIQWDAEALDESSLDYLPRMETDIVLQSNQRTIIIDTKYDVVGLQGFVDGANRTFQFYLRAVDKMNNESDDSNILEADLP